MVHNKETRNVNEHPKSFTTTVPLNGSSIICTIAGEYCVGLVLTRPYSALRSEQTIAPLTPETLHYNMKDDDALREHITPSRTAASGLVWVNKAVKLTSTALSSRCASSRMLTSITSFNTFLHCCLPIGLAFATLTCDLLCHRDMIYKSTVHKKLARILPV